MADATTTNLGLIQPEVGAATNTWGTSLNADILSIDNMFAKASTSVTFHVNNQNISGSGFKLDQIKMGDDRALQFGAAPDYWLMYDSSNTQFELNSTNVNGAGADGVVFYVGDGTDDVFFTGEVDASMLLAMTVKLNDADKSAYVGLDAPSTVSGTYVLTFPAAVGAVNQVLSLNNTDGTLQWATPEVGDITSVVAGTGLSGGGTAGAVTLNVEASQTQITAVGALNAGSITSGFGEIDTGANTIITTGSIRGGNIIVDDAGKLMLEDTTGGEYVAFKAAGTTTSYTLIMPAAVPSANQVLSASDGSGTMAWTTPEVGDITGVTAGTGLSGGGTSGTVTLNVDASQTQITSVGALNAGSITSGFGAIDVGSSALAAGSGTFGSNVSITVADNSAGLQLICTDADASAGPLILLDRDTASPADGDAIGRIYSQGRNDADQLVTYSQITTKSIDVTDGTEDGEMIFNVIVNGTSTTVLDLYGSEIEMNTTLVDMNANLDVSGTATLTGAVTASAGITSTAVSNTFGATSFNDAAITNVGDIALDSVSSDGSTATVIKGASSGGSTELADSVSNAGLFIQSRAGTGGGFALGVTSGVDPYIQGAFSDASATRDILMQPYGGTVYVIGALSKGSGSFRIPHPLPDKKNTHDLVHSFVEGPRADLIYRGSVALSGGSASVDLDEEVGLTDGTWELLCRDPQVFLQNEDGWSALKGSVSGSTLIINCKDTTSTDRVSWMVVAERQDEHMMETSWTDEDGRPILEPLKRTSNDVEDGA